MSHRSVIQKHAVYMPRPLLERPAARSHAKPMDTAPEATPARPVTRARATFTGVAGARKIAQPAGVRFTRPVAFGRSRRSWGKDVALYPAALLLCALVLAFSGLVFGLSALLQQTLRGEAARAAFPLLAGGIMLVLLRGQVGIERYRQVRRSLGLSGYRRGGHALALLYMLAFFFATAIIATLLACGAALLIGAIVHP